MTGDLDPCRLTPDASLNRVRVVDLPGVALPPEVRGALAYDLLAATALVTHLRSRAGQLGFGAVNVAEPDVLLRRFDECFEHPDAAIRAAAEEVAEQFGAYLGYALLTLKRGDRANRAVRPEWGDGYWRHWAGVTRVHIGGGVVAGRLGPRLVAHAAQTLRDAGINDCSVQLARWPMLLPLVGAARAMPPAGPPAVVLDIGHSFIKRARAESHHGALTALRLLPAVSTPPTELTAEGVSRLAAYVASVVADTTREAADPGVALAPTVVVCLAAYIRDGQPLPRIGDPFAAMAAIAGNLEIWLSQRASEQAGQPLEVTLLHDGTAAAYALAGEERAAVITLGTALGVGFSPPADGFRPIGPGFSIT
ncbi:MAG: hypothetical protein H0V86_01185 [Chloroflexia bacterium]|nr:hypothetical protein [Chloroflexia bacterium]